MSEHAENSSTNGKATSPWYQAAVGTAIVAGAFSLIVLGFLIQNHLSITVYDVARAEKLEAMKIAIRNQPDELLESDIRQLDLEIRRNRIRRLDFARKGAYLLFGGVLVFMIALKWAAAVRKKLPAPQLSADGQDRQIREATRARWAVTVALVVLVSGALFLTLGRKVDFSEPGEEAASYATMEEIGRNWASFRGPEGLGISPHANVPTNWNGETGEGVLWKTKVPLPGHNSPVVWGDRVFLSGGDPNALQVYCFDTASGRLLWTGDITRAPLKADEEPLEVMEDTGFAAPTVVTDGRRVYAIFATGDLGCFDFNGRKVWQKNLGLPDSVYGYASSLAMYRNLLLIQYDQGYVEDEMSELIALDAFSGRTVWQAKRPVSNSWSSPTVVNIADQFQVITCSDPWVIAYEPADGTELWRAKCLYGDTAPSAIYAGGLILATEPYSKLVAIRPDGQGDVTETHIAWSNDDGGPDICSPVSNGELIFQLATEGWLSCHNLADGTRVWEHDLRADFRASPSLVGDSLYILSEKGVMFIIEAGPEYKELARCELGEDCCASPAFADGRVYIRGVEHLYCIGQKTEDRRQRTEDRI